MIIYNKKTGDIISQMSDYQDMYLFYINQSDEFKENLACVKGVGNIYPLRNYKIVDGELVARTDDEILEIRLYGKVRTEEERLLEALEPTYEEIQKAESTIEILSTLQEVGLI